jgi:hypothetical protein
MRIVTDVAALLQGLLDKRIDELARETGCVKRERKFSGSKLLATLVLTALENPKAVSRDYQVTAAQLGVDVTENAILGRFTPELVKFLAGALQVVLERTLTADPPPVKLLDRFSEVNIGDSSTITLPDEYAEEFPGCGGAHDHGKAALKVQALWELRSGRLLLFLEAGRSSDAKSAIAKRVVAAGSLSIFDLGYFSINRFQHVEQKKGYWLSRLQYGTDVYAGGDKPTALHEFLGKNARRGVVDIRVRIGKERYPCRLVAIRVSQEIAAKRRQKIRQKARDHGRQPSRAYLQLQEWTIFVTNCPKKLLDWKEVVVLYRARWQIERLFKLWKSYNHLADLDETASAVRQMAGVYIKLIAVIIQHGILLMTVWLDSRRSLWRAAASLRRWIGQLTAVLDDPPRLRRVLERQRQCLGKSARINSRRKHPSCFQLLNDPELLEYTVA